MSVVQPGGGEQRRRGQGQRPGSPGVDSPRRPPGSDRPGQNRNQKAKPQPRTSSSGRGASAGRGPSGGRAGQQPGASKAKGRRNVPVQTVQPRRFSPTTIAYGSVALVVVVVVALVIVKVTSSSNSPSVSPTGAPIRSKAPPSLVAKLTGVSDSVLKVVGLPTAGGNNGTFLQLPKVLKGQPALNYDGKPGALYIGGEFCPYCGAERWALIVAFSRFGTFSNLSETTSSPWDADPFTPTFSFFGASYTSKYLTFRTIENESNDTGPNGAGRNILTPLTSQETSTWTKYSSKFGVSQGFPFVDIGNKVFVTGPSYDPKVLAALNQNQVADKLGNPQDPITKDILGTANYLTAGICAMTGAQPSSVCSTPVVTQASHALKLS